MNWFKSYWKYVTACVLCGGLLWQVFVIKVRADEGYKQSKINAQTQLEIARLANKVNDELQLLLRLGAISKETYEDLRMLPTSPVDDSGNYNKEWYLVGTEEIYLIKLPDECEATVLKIPIE